jgi:chaperone LolA
MRRLPFLLLSAILLFTPSFAQSAESIDPGMLSKVEKRFMETKGFTAKFKQVFHNASMGSVEESTGTVTLEKPLKMRWEYKTPEEQIIVSDGKAIYFYVPAEKRAIVEPLGNIIDSRSPALFLAGGKKLEELFIIKPPQNGDEIGKRDGKMLFSLEPREKSLSVSRLVIAVDPADYGIRALSLYDWAGNRSDMEFSGMEINGKIEKERFIFKRPNGVELLDTPKF